MEEVLVCVKPNKKQKQAYGQQSHLNETNNEFSPPSAGVDNVIHQQHDSSYKFLLSTKKLFVEFLHSFVMSSGWSNAIAEEQVEQISHSFISEDFKRREADVVYRVNLEGQDILFYVLVELQSSVDYRMSYRLLQYQMNLWQYWLQNRKSGLKNRKTFYLPPIVPIVLYNGRKNWTAKRQFRQLLKHKACLAQSY